MAAYVSPSALASVMVDSPRPPACAITAVLLTILLVACSALNRSNSMPSQPTSTEVSFTFANNILPTAVAEKIGSGLWTSVSLSGTAQLKITIPAGISTYGLAYVCPSHGLMAINGQAIPQFVIEATITDSGSNVVTCPTGFPVTGAVTGTVKSSGIADVSSIILEGAQGTTATVDPNSGAILGPLAVSNGDEDIAVEALDTSNYPLAVHILRSQTVPGSINTGSGSVLTLTSSDTTTSQQLTATNVPAGFGPPALNAVYWTAGGTSFGLVATTFTNSTNYAALPASAVQKGDFYWFSASANLASANGESQTVLVNQNTTQVSAVNLVLPAPLALSAPTPAPLPKFEINYAGFSGDPVVSQWGEIAWETNSAFTTLYTTTVTATSAYQNGSTILSIPDLGSLSGFSGVAPSRSTVTWSAGIYGGTYLWIGAMPTSGSLAGAWNSGIYTEP